MTEKSDRQLVEAAMGGDVEAFTELCKRYYPAMVAIARAILGDRHLAEDAAQETFAKASRNLLKLNELDKFAGWLTVICRNVARDMARKAGAGVHTCPLAESAGDIPEIEDKSQHNGHIEAVRSAIGRLAPEAKELIFLHYYDGMTYRQISAVLGISQEAINGRLRRAKKTIAEKLRRHNKVEIEL